MEINDNFLESLVSRTEKITKLSGDLLNTQQYHITQLLSLIRDNHNKLTSELFNLSSEMAQNKLATYATRIENYVVQYLLNAPYDAKKAFSIHKPLFAERHEMAMFLYENLSEIRNRVSHRIINSPKISSKKIKVFTYWDNENNLPDIVKICRKSLYKYISTDKFELIILNSENYKEWVSFRKNEIKAEITQAHFTDILRVKLLEKWGGFWIDATDLITQDFYQATYQICEQDQFIFVYSGSRTGSWFMYSKPNNLIISMVSEAITLWWEKKGYLTNYFMLHDIIEMLYWIDNDYRQSWDKMLKIHPRNALVILNLYHKVESKEVFSEKLNNSFIHKLTYKYNKDNIIEGSVLNYLLDL